jgi:sec-independent protein translocase protein TatC
VFNLVLFALPMCALFFVGIGASYILVLRREKRKFPWGKVLTYALGILAVIAVLMYVLHRTLGYHFVSRFPWFVR